MYSHNRLVLFIRFLVSLFCLLTLPVSFATTKEFCTIGGPLSTDETNKEYTLVINESGTIEDLNFSLNLNGHQHVGGLVLTLKQGTTQVTLIDQPGIPTLTPQRPETTKGCSGWQIPSVILDDEATASIEIDCNHAGSPAYKPNSSYRPNNLLSTFDGQNIQGTWILSVQDKEPTSPNGQLKEWCLNADLVLSGKPNYASLPSPNEILQFQAVQVDGLPQDPSTTSFQPIRISNLLGNANLNVSFKEIAGDKDDFAIDVTPPPTINTLLATVPVGMSNVITVKCDATTLGKRQATLKLTTDDDPDNATLEYQLNCTGLGAKYQTIPTFTNNTILFGDIPILMTTPPIPKTAKIKTFQINNAGNAPLKIDNIQINQSDDWSDFAVIEPANFPITLVDKASLTVKLQCQPSAPGTRQAKLVVTTEFQGFYEYGLQCNGIDDGIDPDQTPKLPPEAKYYSSPPPKDPNNPIEFIAGENIPVEKTLFITEVGGRDLTISKVKLIEEKSDALPNYFSIDKDPSFSTTIKYSSLDSNDPIYLPIKITCKPSPKANGDFLPQKVAKLQVFTYEGTLEDELKKKEAEKEKAEKENLDELKLDEFKDKKEYHLRCDVQPQLAGYEVTYQSPTNQTLFLKPNDTFYVGQSWEKKIRSGQWETAERTLVIRNPGEADLRVAFDSIDNAGFTIKNVDTLFQNPIPPGGQLPVTIQCTPQKSWITPATLTLLTLNAFNLSPDKKQPQKFKYKLECFGVADRPAIYNSTPVSPGGKIDFGSVPTNATQKTTLTMVEDGHSLLWVDLASPLFSGPQASEFKLLDSPFPLFAAETSEGKETTIQVQCEPKAQGERRATLNLITNGWPNDQQPPHQDLPSKRIEDLGRWSVKYNLICNGVQPGFPGFASLPTPNSTIEFGQVKIGANSTQDIEIEEIGNEDLLIKSAMLTGEQPAHFSIITPESIPFTIANGGAKQILTVQCQPTAAEQYKAKLELTTNDPNNLTVAYDLTCQGILAAPTPVGDNQLVIQLAGEGSGAVTSDPQGIVCNKNNETTCAFSFVPNAVVTLIPKAALGAKFDHWSGDCNEQGQITIAGQQSCAAHFQLLPPTQSLFNLTVSVSGKGKVTSKPMGILCGDGNKVCTFDYEEGTTVTLTTSFDSTAWRFRGWVGCTLGKDNTTSVVMTKDQKCQAIFVPVVPQSSSQLNCPNTPILYVKQSAVGNNTGLNWNDAFTDLQAALTTATHCDPVNQIWVAEGTYKPTTQSDRTATFQLLNGVAIYGGFSGTETQLQQRDSANHLTILSGDIGVVGDPNDNSYHVVTGSGTDQTALLDGVTLTAGQANGSQNCPLGCGGGLFNDQGSPTLQHLLVENNSAYYGGGLLNNAGSHPTVKYSFFKNNTATGGGGMANFNSNPTVSHVFFMANTATQVGGGLLNQTNSQPQLTHLNLMNNSAVYGGGMYNDASSPWLSHSIFSQNQASHSGGGLVNKNNSHPWLSHVVFGNNSAVQVGGALWNENSSLLLVHTTLSENEAASGGGLANQASSVQITNSILWNNKDNTGTTATAQIKDDPNPTTVTYSIIQGGWLGEGNKNEDPLFAAVENSKTQHVVAKVFHLAALSPAIDAGNTINIPQDLADAECKGGDGNTIELIEIDFDGNPRLLDGNNDNIATVDMGAYEVYSSQQQPVTLTVINTDFSQESIIKSKLSNIHSNLPGIDCGNDCTQEYPYGTEIILMAQESNHSQFVGWSGDCQSDQSDIRLSMTENKTCKALFKVTTAVSSTPTNKDSPNHQTDKPVVIPEQPTIASQIQSLPPACKEIQGSFVNVTCNLSGQTRQEITLGSAGNISNVALEGTNYSQGWISNAQLAAHSSLMGGILSGVIDNNGTISHIEFRGAQLTGGLLSGLIINNSPVNGRIENVSLDADAYLLGGTLAGEINNLGTIRDVFIAADTRIRGGTVTGTLIGQSTKTSVLENVRVVAGSCLENVKLGQGVQLEKNVITTGHCPQPQLSNALITQVIPAAGQTFKNAVISTEGKLIQAVLQGTTRSLGTVADAILAPHSVLIGGILQGQIINEGTLTDVNLAAYTHIVGGTLQGFVIGDEAHPARLENVTISAGSYLENVKLGKDVQLAAGVIYGKGVEHITQLPATIEDIITDSVEAKGETFENIMIAPTGVLSHAVLAGMITNLGQISTATLSTESTLTGGIISGQFTNQGMVKNIQLNNATLTGGLLAGQITGTQSIIQNVTLTPNTVIEGGQLQGQIKGDAYYPAILNNVQIANGSYLENVILGKNVQVAEKVTYGAGIQQIAPSDLNPMTLITNLVQAEGQTLSMVTITTQGKLFNPTLTGTITNQGTIAHATLLPGTIINGGYLTGNIISDGGTLTEVTLAAKSHLTGGQLQGQIQGEGEALQRPQLDLVTIMPNSYVTNTIIGQQVTNNGTIADSEFQGANLEGGTLAGVILNTRGGMIRDVQLAAGAQIQGGNLMGEIKGDPTQPARLENVTIIAGSLLDNVIIDLATSTLAKEVKLGANVQVINQTTHQPTLVQPNYAASALIKIAPNEYVVKNIDDSPTAPHFVSEIRTLQGLQPNHALLSYIQAEEISLEITIQVAPEQLGKAADIIIVRSYQSLEQITYTLRKLDEWIPWNKNPRTLKAAQTIKQLPQQLTVKIADKMDLSQAAGEYTFYAGYRLSDGTIIYNGATPLHFFVENAPPACNLYAVHDEGVSDTQFLKIDLSYLGLKGVMTPLGPLYPNKNIEGLALHPANPNVLYGTAGLVAGQKSALLYTIDRFTGEILSQVPLTVPGESLYFNEVASLAVNWNDKTLERLWSWAEASQKNNNWIGLIQIDPNTGLTTPVKQFTYEDCQARYIAQLEQKQATNDGFQQHYADLTKRNKSQSLTQLEPAVEKFIYEQCHINALAWSYNVANQEEPKLYAAGKNTLWIYNHTDTQELELACVNVVPASELIEGLEMQPNGLLLFGIDHRSTKETSIIAYDPKTCRVVKERTFSKELAYHDIESIVWPVDECFNQSWLWPEERSD